MLVYLTWLVLDMIMAGGGLSNMVGVGFNPGWCRFMVDVLSLVGVCSSNMVGVRYYHGWRGFI